MGEQDILSIGRALRIPGRGDVTGVSGVEPAAGGLLYTVTSGDTLITIAKRYAIDWNEIAAANRLNDYSVLQIGMQLRLPGVPEEGEEGATDAAAQASETTASAAPQVAISAVKASGTTYAVRAGDTLYTIAVRNKVTWQALADSQRAGRGRVSANRPEVGDSDHGRRCGRRRGHDHRCRR